MFLQFINIIFLITRQSSRLVSTCVCSFQHPVKNVSSRPFSICCCRCLKSSMRHRKYCHEQDLRQQLVHVADLKGATSVDVKVPVWIHSDLNPFHSLPRPLSLSSLGVCVKCSAVLILFETSGIVQLKDYLIFKLDFFFRMLWVYPVYIYIFFALFHAGSQGSDLREEQWKS